MIRVEVLGPVTVRDEHGPLPVGGPRHRELLARLVAARGRVVPLPVLIDDLWPVAPAGARSAVRTFVSALRAAMDPAHALLVTEGPGYALRGVGVDAWELERLPPEAALALWRGPAFADFPDAEWARAERGRLTALRLSAVEALARQRVDGGRGDEAVPDLEAHVAEHPWREEGWRLLALAHYRADRPGDALIVLRRARTLLADELGTDPGPRLAELETAILQRAPRLDSTPDRLFAQAAAAWSGSAAATLESTVTLLRGIALSGPGPVDAARRRPAVIAAAEELGDPVLTARVIGAYDLPGSWARSDDPAGAAAVVAAAERTLRALPEDEPSLRARLLGTIALESRGLPGPRGGAAAGEADRIARELGDPALRAFALAGRWMQTFHRCGLAAERDALGRELLDLPAAPPNFAVLGHLVRMQALSALGDLEAAAVHAGTADSLAARHDRPSVAVLTRWFAAMRAARDGAPDAADRYRAAAAALRDRGMPGVEHGLLDLALTCLAVQRGEPVPEPVEPGPYARWIGALRGGPTELPDPPPDQLQEALWVLAGRAGLAAGDDALVARAAAALAPAEHEIAGAGSGMITVGTVAETLRDLRARDCRQR